MKKLIIIGGGGHARSIYGLLKENKLTKGLLGYSDFKKSNLPLKYLGNDQKILDLYKKNKVELILGIGINLSLRTKVINKFKNYNFLTLIDKKAIISDKSKVKKGCIIFPNASISSNVKINDFSVIHNSAVIEHDVDIGKNSYIGPAAVICGNAMIGKNVLIGANSTMIQDTFVADNCKLGAGSVLIKSCRLKNKILIGSPAKIKK